MQTAPTTSTSSGPSSKKVTQKGYFNWNKDLEHVLAKEVFRAHAYKNTKDSSMKVKCQIVLTCLKATYPVKDGDIEIHLAHSLEGGIASNEANLNSSASAGSPRKKLPRKASNTPYY